MGVIRRAEVEEGPQACGPAERKAVTKIGAAFFPRLGSGLAAQRHDLRELRVLLRTKEETEIKKLACFAACCLRRNQNTHAVVSGRLVCPAMDRNRATCV